MKKIFTIILLLSVSACNNTTRYEKTYEDVSYNPSEDSLLIKLQNKLMLIDKQDSIDSLTISNLEMENISDSLYLQTKELELSKLKTKINIKEKPQKKEVVTIKVFSKMDNEIEVKSYNELPYKKIVSTKVDTIIIHDTVLTPFNNKKLKRKFRR